MLEPGRQARFRSWCSKERGGSIPSARIGRKPKGSGARPAAEALERIATGAKALGDPTRLALRAGEELCVCDLSWVVERNEKLVSHHVRTLKAAGIVRSRRDGKMLMYSLTHTGGGLLDAVLRPALGAAR